jgi:type IV pilus assembly protein PilV
MSLTLSTRSARARRFAAGFSIVEALVALVILSVGMLGIAGLYLESLRSNRTAGSRTVAVQLVNDMADRIRANRAGLDQYILVDGTAPTGGANCLTTLCTPAQLALYDKVQWYTAVQAQLPKGPDGTIPPRTAITYTAAAGTTPARYVVTTWWRETGDAAYLSSSVEVLILGAT